jgi:hypothetical protein
MMDLLLRLCLLLLGCVLSSAALTPLGGFVGPYHPTNELYPDGSNRSVFDTFQFGVTALQNSATERGWLLADDLSFHCSEHDSNQVMAIMIPPSEKGVVNNPSDTSLLIPATPPGLVQGAARFSKLASNCPQLTGVIIDDFLQNYAGNMSGPCVPCPSSHPYPYGNPASGEFCCPWPLDQSGHCTALATTAAIAPAAEEECCIKPGENFQCQGYARCGVNPQNYTACNLTHGEKQITLHDVIQIKGALMGMDIDPSTGVVDLTSPAKTPWLRLYIVWYTRFTEGYADDGLLAGSIDSNNGSVVPIVDGISLWIEGTSQHADYLNWTNCVLSYRSLTDLVRPSSLPRLITYGGAYIEHSRIGIMEPTPFWSIFNQTLELYEETQLDGFFIFAGSSIPKLNSTMMKRWNLEQNLNAWYQPNLGRACGTIAKPFTDVRVLVTTTGGKYTQLVTSKYAKENGIFCFDGWAGRENESGWMFEISSTDKYGRAGSRATQVQLKRGEVVSFLLQ